MKDIRCGKCSALLFRAGHNAISNDIEIKCRRCGTINHLRPAEPATERQERRSRSSDHVTCPVKPISPPAAYIGGKRILARTIIERINATPHNGYAEPFVGMGGVFLRRTSKPRTEVINDFNGEVANLFRILQRHYPQFMETLKFQITSRREFKRLVDCEPSTLTDLERAARFLYLQRLTFGGKVTGQSFGVDKDSGGRFNVTRLGPVLEDIHERMAGVVIEQLHWRDFLRRWDRPGMMFYLDPPYYGNEDDYGTGMFARQDFEEMATALKGLRGCFKLSLNDRPEVRAVFQDFEMESINCTYSIAGGAGKKVREVIISG